MASNVELTQENKKLTEQVAALETQLKADVVRKSDYDKVKAELDALNQQMNAISFPTLQKELETAKRDRDTLKTERDVARNSLVEAANRIRGLERNQRVDQPTEENEEPLNCSASELRSIAALALPFCREDTGRPLNASTIASNASGWVSGALKLAKEIVRQTS